MIFTHQFSLMVPEQSTALESMKQYFHNLDPQMQDVAVFNQHHTHIHKHVILALCRGVLHSVPITFLV